MAGKTIRTVDFIPQYDMLGDIKKVSEYDFAIQNANLIPIITIVCMEQGSNVLYPDMGLREVLRSLPYKEMSEVYGTLEEINSHIYKYTKIQTRVYIDEKDSRTDLVKGEVSLRIDVEGIFAPLAVDVDKHNGFFVRHPSLFMGK